MLTVHQIVYGEVYDMDDQCLEWMDEFEGHPTMYERDKVKVQMLSSADANDSEMRYTECWVYFIKKFQPEVLELETFSSYDSNGKHGRLYCPKLVQLCFLCF